jgi:hypothetical protein
MVIVHVLNMYSHFQPIITRPGDESHINSMIAILVLKSEENFDHRGQ